MGGMDSTGDSLTLYYWPTPNGFKITIMLAELGIDYRLVPVDITRGEQHTSRYQSISPNGKIPALIDASPRDGRDKAVIFESGAILLYLAEKYDQFLPKEVEARSQTVQWLFWQMGGLGPMAGQAHHFRLYADEKIAYAIRRYTNECRRLYTVMNLRLRDRNWLAGEYSIADIACLPWIFRHERQGQDLAEFTDLQAWYQRLMARDAVRHGLGVAAELRDDAAFTSATGRAALFSLDD